MSTETNIPINIAVSITDAYERGRRDINFFASLCMPNIFRFSLPPFYIAAWQLIVGEGDPKRIESLFRFALGLPRGHAKTTFIKILIAWMIVYDYASFILIVCSNSSLAENLLADIDDILSSDNVVSIYGEWAPSKAIDSKDTKKAAYHTRSVTLVARGWTAGIRGINLKNERPDFIFCDDVQTKDNDSSPTERQHLLEELTGTIFKSVSHRGRRTIVYVGNLYSEECILQKFRQNPYWTSMITGAILSDGQPLWPELVSLAELKESYEHDEALGLSHIWFAEVMNDPQSVQHSLLPMPVPDSDVDEIVLDDGAFLTIDPAGFRSTSDDNVIVLHKKYNNKGYVCGINAGIKNPAELIKEAITIAIQNGVSLIGVEAVAYQQTLGYWISHFLKELGITHIHVVELMPHGRSKESRMRLFVEELYRKTYFLHDPSARRAFNWQGSLYKIGKKNNKDDILDAVSYGLDIRNEYWHLIYSLASNASQIDHTICSVEHNSCF
jgi:hypothetical protein